MTIQDLGALATSTNAILTLLTLVIGGIFSRKLWRGVKRMALSITSFMRGIATVGEMAPQLASLPAQLADTQTKLEGLDATFRARTDQNTATNNRLASLADSVERIDKQLNPNGGGSLHDAVMRIANDLGGVKHNMYVINGVMRISWDQLGNFGTFYAALDGGFTFISAVVLRWCNRTLEEFTGRNWINYIHPADRAMVVTEWNSCISDKRNFQAEFRMISDDEAFTVACKAEPMKGEDGNVTMWIGVIQRSEARIS